MKRPIVCSMPNSAELKYLRASFSILEAENTGLVAKHGELAATLAGETRCLRAIIEIVIWEMVAKLKQ